MPKRKVIAKIIFPLSIVFLLSGCWDRTEIENRAYVIGLGIDRSKQENRISVTMLVANPEVGSMQGGGGSNEKPREIITFDAIDIISAKSTANAIISRDITYELLKIIVISEEFAKDPRLLPMLRNTLKDKEIHLDAFLAVSKEKAADYFHKNRPKMETRPHKYFEFMTKHGIDNGFIPDSTLFRFFKITDRGTDLATAMYTSAEKAKDQSVPGEDDFTAGQLRVTGELDDTQFMGAAVFKNGVLLVVLNGRDTRLTNILDDTTEIQDILINFADPFSEQKDQMAARVTKTKNNQIDMNLKGPKPKIRITIPLNFTIMSNPSMVNFTEEKNREILHKHLTNNVEMIFEDFLKRSQSELKAAPYPLSVYAQKYFGTIKEYNDFDWEKSYPEAEITVKADIKIIDFNKTDRKPQKTEDEH